MLVLARFTVLVGVCGIVGCAEPSPPSETPSTAVASGQAPRGRSAAMPDKANWTGVSCTFPAEADTAKIDAAAVVIRVLVKADGSPELVQTIEEPGFGFGPAATSCAMARKYVPASSERGTAVRGWTLPIRIKFLR